MIKLIEDREKVECKLEIEFSFNVVNVRVVKEVSEKRRKREDTFRANKMMED